MLFKLRKGKGSVHSLLDAAGIRRFPGDVVELPASYSGLKWLEPVEKKEAKVVPTPSKVEHIPDSAIQEKSEPVAPLEARRKQKPKSLSS